MKIFRTLKLAEDFYHLSEKANLKGNLRDQLLRASSSIALNLAEGNAKRTPKEKRCFYHIAYASAQECKTILRLAKLQDKELTDTIDKLGAHIFRLMNAKINTLPYTGNC